MIAFRETSLKEFAQKFAKIDDRLLGQSVVYNGAMFLQADVEAENPQRFTIRISEMAYDF